MDKSCPPSRLRFSPRKDVLKAATKVDGSDKAGNRFDSNEAFGNPASKATRGKKPLIRRAGQNNMISSFFAKPSLSQWRSKMTFRRNLIELKTISWMSRTRSNKEKSEIVLKRLPRFRMPLQNGLQTLMLTLGIRLKHCSSNSAQHACHFLLLCGRHETIDKSSVDRKHGLDWCPSSSFSGNL